MTEHEPELAAAARAVMAAKESHDVAKAITEVVWGSDKNLQPPDAIQKAIESDNVGVAMEGIIAKLVEQKFPGGDLLGVAVPVPDPTNPSVPLTDLDLLMKFAIVEIKTGEQRLGKKLDVKRSFGLPVVVYAPQATLNQQSDLRRKGAIWVGSSWDLFDAIERAKKQHEKIESKIIYPK